MLLQHNPKELADDSFMTSKEVPSHIALQHLATAVTRMVTIMDSFQEPVIALLHEALTAQPSTKSIGSIEDILSASPIAQLLKDDNINDILINGPFEIFINRQDTLERTDITFPDHYSLRNFAKSIAASVGRPLDPRRPLVNAHLKDGSRVNIISPPMAVDGLAISIRKFPKQEITLDKLVAKKKMTLQIATFLALCAESRASILISGGTGTGKTTLLNAISRYIPDNERIISIEDTAELRLQQPHVVRLETKESSIPGESREEVDASALVRNALRMRPDRIIVGEVRGIEAYDMIQAMNTGHDGSMTTIHANAPRDALARLENLISLRMQNTPAVSLRRQIVSALNFIVQLTYNQDGRRMVSSITEIVGMEGDIPTMQEIFTLKEDNTATSIDSKYRQEWTSIIPRHPKLSERMRSESAFSITLNGRSKT